MRLHLLNSQITSNYNKNSCSVARGLGGVLYYSIWLSHAKAILEIEGYIVRLVYAPAWNCNLKNVMDDLKKIKISCLN